MVPEKNEHQLLHELMLENQKLLQENNKLVKKMHRAILFSFWLRVVWFLFIVGAPFILYFYVVEPYFNSMGSSFERFQDGLQEVPGWKQFYQSISGGEG